MDSLKSLALISLLLTGCGTTMMITKLNNSPRPLEQRTPESVYIFMTGKPEKPYIEISLITSQQASEFSNDNTPQIIQKMRLEAAKQGCDALIISGPNDATVGSTNSRGTGSVTTLTGFHGACIVYKD